MTFSTREYVFFQIAQETMPLPINNIYGKNYYSAKKVIHRQFTVTFFCTVVLWNCAALSQSESLYAGLIEWSKRRCKHKRKLKSVHTKKASRITLRNACLFAHNFYKMVGNDIDTLLIHWLTLYIIRRRRKRRLRTRARPRNFGHEIYLLGETNKVLSQPWHRIRSFWQRVLLQVSLILVSQDLTVGI